MRGQDTTNVEASSRTHIPLFRPLPHLPLQVVTLDFAKAPEPSLTAATLLGSCIKAAAPLLLGAAPDTAAAAGGSSGGAAMPLPQELLHTKV